MEEEKRDGGGKDRERKSESEGDWMTNISLNNLLPWKHIHLRKYYIKNGTIIGWIISLADNLRQNYNK